MKRLIGVSIVLLSVAAFAGDVAARAKEIAAWLPEKPCVEGAPLTDARWGELAQLPEGVKTIQAAEKLLAKPVPETPDELYLQFTRNGNRTNFERCYGARRGGFLTLLTAECFERKGRFLAKIVEYAEALCAMKSWNLPAHDAALTSFKGDPHIDLFSAAVGLDFAFCLQLVGDRLPEATRTKMRAEVERRMFVPHLRHVRGERRYPDHWWFHARNNWNSVCNSCVVRAALMLVEDRLARAEYVAYAEDSVPYAISGYTDDGYCSEGMGYWNYGYGHHLYMGLAVRKATGGHVDFFADPKTKKVMEYAYTYQIHGGISPHIADGGGNASPVLLALGRQVWPDLVSTTALKVPLLTGGLSTFALRAFGQEPAPAAPTMDVPALRSWFSDAQVLISRTDPANKDIQLGISFKGGNNAENHNHNDLGAYTILLDYCEMSGDPGGETYTRRTFSRDRYVSKVLNSYGHPVPVVGGKLQKVGGAAQAKVFKVAFTPEKDMLTIDYTSAYPVPALKSLVRTMTFDRVKYEITIKDKVIFTEPTTFEVPVITYRTWKKDEAAKHFTFDKSNGVRKLNLDVSASAPLDFSSEAIENPGHASPQRLTFRFREPVTEAIFCTKYSTR